MNEKIDPKDCNNLHCWHPHPSDPSKEVCIQCDTVRGGKPAEEPKP